jgi:2,3-bisphosphoglycerate-dependent phosphoglycerate mutase
MAGLSIQQQPNQRRRIISGIHGSECLSITFSKIPRHRDRGCDKLRQRPLNGIENLMPELVLMRHGATLWGQENKFAGWGDTPLSPAGVQEAVAAGRALAQRGFRFDAVLTSRLLRAAQTVEHLQQALHYSNENIERDWRLNERHYGALQGYSRSDMIKQHGNALVVAWRRSFDAVPPPLMPDDPRWLEQLQRLSDIPQNAQPRSESMGMAAVRAGQVWNERIKPALKVGQSLLVVGHTSSLRGLSKVMLGLDDATAESFRIATAVPRLYRFDSNLQIVSAENIQSGSKSTLRSWINRLKPKSLGQL